LKDIDWIQKNVEGSMKVEGAIPSDVAKKLNRKYLEGKMTSDEVIKRIIEHWIR
jgi:hypothetical protein